MHELLRQFVLKNRELISYLFFGVVTVGVNWIVYVFLVTILKQSVEMSNGVAWVCAVLVAYITNRKFVFFSENKSIREKAKEVGLFFGSRIISGVIEIGGFLILYYAGLNQTLFGIDGFVAKLLISVFVIIFNYVVSKIVIFKKKVRRNE